MCMKKKKKMKMWKDANISQDEIKAPTHGATFG